MAISASSASISYLISDRRTNSSTVLCKCSSSSLSSLQLQFPLHLRRQLRSTTSRSPPLPRHRALPLIEAKKKTFSSFDEMIKNADKPVLVDFYATWCGPCQLMVPILEEANAALEGKVQVAKVDTEKYPSLANKYKIEALPTFILFKDGKPSDRFEGALPAEKLIQRIEASLAVKQ